MTNPKPKIKKEIGKIEIELVKAKEQNYNKDFLNIFFSIRLRELKEELNKL